MVLFKFSVFVQLLHNTEKFIVFYDRSFIFTNFLKSHRFQNLFYQDNGWIGFYE